VLGVVWAIAIGVVGGVVPGNPRGPPADRDRATRDLPISVKRGPVALQPGAGRFWVRVGQ
jgi:hypothetical protein